MQRAEGQGAGECLARIVPGPQDLTEPHAAPAEIGQVSYMNPEI